MGIQSTGEAQGLQPGLHSGSTLTRGSGAGEELQRKQTAGQPRDKGRQEAPASPLKSTPAPVSRGTTRSGPHLKDLPHFEREKLPEVFTGNHLLERSDLHMLILPHHKNKCANDPGYKALQSEGVSPVPCLFCLTVSSGIHLHLQS